MTIISDVHIGHGETEELVEAKLFDSILEKHLNDFKQLWVPFREEILQKDNPPEKPEHSHWKWGKKIQQLGGLLAFPSFAIECAGETQGLMIVNLSKSCQLDSQKNKPLAYIEFVETAPWNSSLVTNKRFKGVGSLMISVAIQLSIDEGYKGRLGLHSLPQSEEWYAKKVNMTDLGKDPSYSEGLRYFEITSDQASKFLNNS